MMQFEQFNLLVRESVNGTMALSALLLIVIFGRYSWRNRRVFWHSETAQAAAAIVVLMIGHFVRAFSSWIEFLLVDLGWSTSNWIKWTWIWFLIAAALIIAGKSLMLYTFAPRKCRWAVLTIGIPVCVLVPIVIAFAVGR
jgi:hypothetical protein